MTHRLKWISTNPNGDLHGPFNAKAEADEYAKLMGIADYEITFECNVKRMYPTDRWNRVDHRRHTKS